MFEPYTVKAYIGNTDRVWTRSTLDGAYALADNIARTMGVDATVTLTETGYIEYIAYAAQWADE